MFSCTLILIFFLSRFLFDIFYSGYITSRHVHVRHTHNVQLIEAHRQLMLVIIFTCWFLRPSSWTDRTGWDEKTSKIAIIVSIIYIVTVILHQQHHRFRWTYCRYKNHREFNAILPSPCGSKSPSSPTIYTLHDAICAAHVGSSCFYSCLFFIAVVLVADASWEMRVCVISPVYHFAYETGKF